MLNSCFKLSLKPMVDLYKLRTPEPHSFPNQNRQKCFTHKSDVCMHRFKYGQKYIVL